MTPGEKRRVRRLLEAANAMARREPGATERYRDLLEQDAGHLLGPRVGERVAGEATASRLRSPSPAQRRRAARRHAERKAALAIAVVELEDVGRKEPRTREEMEERAVQLMDEPPAALRRMRVALRRELN